MRAVLALFVLTCSTVSFAITKDQIDGHWTYESCDSVPSGRRAPSGPAGFPTEGPFSLELNDAVITAQNLTPGWPAVYPFTNVGGPAVDGEVCTRRASAYHCLTWAKTRTETQNAATSIKKIYSVWTVDRWEARETTELHLEADGSLTARYSDAQKMDVCHLVRIP